MRLVLWGDWLPDHVESLVQELRIRSYRPRLTVQLDPATKSVDFCNVQADEFVRAEGADSEALRHCLEAQGSARLALNLWSLLSHDNFDSFLEGLERASAAADSVVCWLPRPWSATGLQTLFGVTDPHLRLLVERCRRAFETIWNRDMGALLSSAPRELLEVVTGRRELSPLVRLGIPLWPDAMLRQEARFVERQEVARALVDALDSDGRSPHWMVEVVCADSFRIPDSARAHGWIPGCSWESYCLPPLLGHLASGRGKTISSAQLAQWCFLLGAVEASAPLLAQQREAAARTIFPA